MTPAQLDHLRRIDAHLANLLSTAEKRTKGDYHSRGTKIHDVNSRVVASTATLDFLAMQSEYNAAFIAACAGNAEAGWKATRAAIADWLSLYNSTEGYADGAPDATAHDKLCNEVASICRINLQRILADFPNV